MGSAEGKIRLAAPLHSDLAAQNELSLTAPSHPASHATMSASPPPPPRASCICGKKRVRKLKTQDGDVRFVGEHWSLYVQMILFFEEWFWRCLMILRGFNALFWLVVLWSETGSGLLWHHDDIKIVALVFLSFVYFWSVFLFYQMIKTRRATSQVCHCQPVWHHDDVMMMMSQL